MAGGASKPSKPSGGGGKPQSSGRVSPTDGGGSTPPPDQSNSGGGPTKSSPVSDDAQKKAGDTAGKGHEQLKENIHDAKEVAKAFKPGSNTKGDIKEVKQAFQEKGAKGAAGEVGRKAVGKGVEAGVTAVTGGAAKPIAKPIGKIVEKALKKENLKKIAIGIIAVLTIPLLLIGIALYFIANPWKLVEKVLTDDKMRSFAIQAVKLAARELISNDELYKKYGFVEYKPGTALASHVPPPALAEHPLVGSLAYKMLLVDYKKAQWQTIRAPDCPYRYTTKALMGPEGQIVNAIDEIYLDTSFGANNTENKAKRGDFLVDYCIGKSMPLYNMMVRTSNTRKVNKFSNTNLIYAEPKDSPNIKGKSPKEIKDYVYTKTYKRITPPDDDEIPKTEIPDVDNFIKDVRAALRDNLDPDSLSYTFTGIDEQSNTKKTLCAFSKGYLKKSNLKKGILSRINSGQRSGIKTNTLSSTRELGLLTNEELSPTFKQLDGWASSRAYSQNLYGSQSGEAIDPERLGNTSYGGNYTEVLALLYDIREICEGGVIDDEQEILDADYEALQNLIVTQSNGKFINRDSFGIEQLMQGVIRMGAGSAISGLEATGQQNFNNQSQGYRALSNQYMMSIGGRFLTKEEANKADLLAENTRREVENKNGIAYRLFGEDNIRSLANVMQYETPRTLGEFERKTKQFIASISNPIKLLADLHSSFSYIALGQHNQAFAAGATGDAYMRLNTVGLPAEDAIDSEGRPIKMIENSDYIQELLKSGTPGSGTPDQKRVLGYFEKCSKSNIPTKDVFARLYDVEIESGEAVIDRSRDNMQFKNDYEGTNLNLPQYPAIDSVPGVLKFANIRELIACELYLLPKREHAMGTYRDYVDYKGRDMVEEVQIPLFGFDIQELAKRYRLYLYANAMVDLMVQLSNTEQDDSIYAKSDVATVTPTPPSGGSGVVGNIAESSGSAPGSGIPSPVPCPPGTDDMGVSESQYDDRALFPGLADPLYIQLCQIGAIPGTGQHSNKSGTNSGAVVNSRVAGAWLALGQAANAANIGLRSSSSYRWEHSCGGGGGGTGCARPGKSPHQLGIAIDFSDMGGFEGRGSSADCSNRMTHTSPQWTWMRDNARRWGIRQYSFESWHWDLIDTDSRCRP